MIIFYNDNIWQVLTKEVSELLASLGDKVEARTKVLQLGLPDNIRKKIRWDIK